MTDAPVAAGRVVADRYVMGRLLGSGAMGTVWAAFDRDLEREVAMKVVTTGGLSREESSERFRREVHVVARMKSEHVVRIYDVGTLDDGTPFMVMEVLEGRGLDAEREARGVLPIEEAVAYLLPAVEVLAEAHAAGVVHRDIKPANVFLVERGDAPRFVKILDFGVSKAAAELGSSGAITQSGAIMGSPLYMAPEQLRASSAVDARADIWSLGAVLFELVTGYTAHSGDSVAELCATLLRDHPRPITDFGSELPPGFAEVVMRCLEPDPERRYANVAELGAALLPFAPSGAAHVERAQRVLALPIHAPTTLAPASDSPLTIELPGTLGALAERESAAERASPEADGDRPRPSGVHITRTAMAFGLVGLGLGTLFLLEFPRGSRPEPITVSARAPAARLAEKPLPEPVSSLAAGVPHVVPSSALNAELVAAPSVPAPAEVRRPARRRKPHWNSKLAAPRPASSSVSDFGGRR
ncbi:MAG TPA: serine/threonine-protein kinase [Polyangiaceae bacterium]